MKNKDFNFDFEYYKESNENNKKIKTSLKMNISSILGIAVEAILLWLLYSTRAYWITIF